MSSRRSTPETRSQTIREKGASQSRGAARQNAQRSQGTVAPRSEPSRQGAKRHGGGRK